MGNSFESNTCRNKDGILRGQSVDTESCVLRVDVLKVYGDGPSAQHLFLPLCSLGSQDSMSF